MTPTPDRPTFWTPQNVLGFFLTACGVALGAWSKADNTLTSPTLIAVGLLIAAGMYFVDPVRLSGYVHEVRDAAPALLSRGGQLTVPQAPGQTVVVEREEAGDVVVPPKADAVTTRDRLAHNTAETVRMAALPDPTVSRRRRRKSDDAPPLAEAQEHPAFTAPPSATPRDDDEGLL